MVVVVVGGTVVVVVDGSVVVVETTGAVVDVAGGSVVVVVVPPGSVELVVVVAAWIVVEDVDDVDVVVGGFGIVVVVVGCGVLQSDSHPSPPIVLPSSHSSPPPASTIRSPHRDSTATMVFTSRLARSVPLKRVQPLVIRPSRRTRPASWSQAVQLATTWVTPVAFAFRTRVCTGPQNGSIEMVGPTANPEVRGAVAELTSGLLVMT